MSACQLFGYPKAALLTRNVKALIPEMIGKNHNKALLEAEKKEVSYFTKRHNFFTYGRQMTGYIFPMYINVKKVLSFSLLGDQYGALIYPLPSVVKSQEMHLLLDLKLHITEVSESCYRILRIRKEVIRRQKVPIRTLIPGFPAAEKLEQELASNNDCCNQSNFALEEELNVFVPQINEKPRSDSSVKLQFADEEDNSGGDEDDSALSNLRKNEAGVTDSFIFKENFMQMDSDDAQDDEQEGEPYTIDVGEEKIPCKVGVSCVSVLGHVGYAVRLVRADISQNAKSVALLRKQGKYQLQYNPGFNTYFRLPVDGRAGVEKETVLVNDDIVGLFSGAGRVHDGTEE
ncbi:MAG: hypothetical protein P4M11_09890 [Candidatus Pacebacteria bacterium]|nr:hypothetical protein [Candidatus Paceibacterota bacterium]